MVPCTRHHRACARGTGCRAGGLPSPNAGITSAANSRMDFCASRTSSAPKLICREACSNLPIAPLTRAMMSLLSLGGAVAHAGDDVPDFVGGADPCAAGFDLTVEGERAQPAHRGIVIAIVLGGRAA